MFNHRCDCNRSNHHYRARAELGHCEVGNSEPIGGNYTAEVNVACNNREYISANKSHKNGKNLQETFSVYAYCRYYCETYDSKHPVSACHAYCGRSKFEAYYNYYRTCDYRREEADYFFGSENAYQTCHNEVYKTGYDESPLCVLNVGGFHCRHYWSDECE